VIEREPDGKTRELAVKRIVFDPRDEEALLAVKSEIEIMAALPPHPNVLRLIGHCRRMRPKNGGEEAYMLLELCGQSLASHLQRRAGMGTDGGTPTLRPGSSVASGLGGGSIRGGYSNGHGDHYRDSHDAEEHRRSVYAGGATWEMGLTGGGNGTIGVNKTIGMDPLQTADVLSIFLDMVHAVAHLHSQPAPVAHRDVKPENFLPSTRDGRWKLCDFGSASTETFVYTPGPERDGGTPAALLAFEEERIHRASTPMYRAPEMNDLRSIEEVGPKVDVWALGVSLFKLVFLRDLFGMAGEERLGVLNFDPDARLNRTSALRMLPHGGNPHSEQNLEVLLALMKLCLIKRASERPAARDVLQWIYAQAPIERFLPSSALTTERLYAPGILTLTVVAARNLHGKGSTNAAGGAGCYVVLWCAGVRRSGAKTALTVDGNASWGRGTCELVVPTHSLESLDLAVWGTRPGKPLQTSSCNGKGEERPTRWRALCDLIRHRLCTNERCARANPRLTLTGLPAPNDCSQARLSRTSSLAASRSTSKPPSGRLASTSLFRPAGVRCKNGALDPALRATFALALLGRLAPSVHRLRRHLHPRQSPHLRQPSRRPPQLYPSSI